MQSAALLCILVLMLCGQGCMRAERTAGAILLDIATVPKDCGDSRTIVATAVGNRRATLNTEAGRPFSEAALRLREVFKAQPEKVIFVKADPEVEVGEFAVLLDSLRPEAEVISLVTPQVEALGYQRHCLAPSCGRCEKFQNLPTRSQRTGSRMAFPRSAP